MKKLLVAIPPLILLSSCYSYKIYPAEYRDFEYKEQKKIIAFIENPELKKEYRILKKSGIFEISENADAADVKIKLYPFRRTNLICGNALVGSAVTLGQIPVIFPDAYQFKFDEISKMDTVAKQFELHIAKRIWFWDMFTFNKNFAKKSGHALLADYYTQKK